MPLGSGSTILIPVDVASDSHPAQSLVDLCRSVDVVLLGYYPVRDQAPPAQIKAERESEAASTLEEIADVFRTSGIDVTETLVFTERRRR